jgi:multisubunit Na+/H+ antiporter MnhF subunit
MILNLLAQHDPHAAQETAAEVIAMTSDPTWARVLLFFVVDLGIFALFVTTMWCLYRILRGPQLVDRAIAADTLSLQIVGMAILFTIRYETLMYFDAVLIMAIMGFASTVAFAQYIARVGKPA